MSRPIRITALCLLGLAIALGAVVAAGLIIVQTAWFKDKVRERIVSVAESATGGRVEIGSFSYDWHNLTAEVAPFVLHGTEAPAGPPLFHAGRIRIGLKIISALERRVDIASLTVDEPQVYVIVAPDGSTNVPAPRVASRKNAIEQLLDFKIGRFELHRGLIDYDQRQIPLEARGENLEATLAYEAAAPRYLGAISARQLRLSSPKFQAPAAFDLDAKVSLEKNAIQVLQARLASGALKIEAHGAIDNLMYPRAAFDLTAAAPVADLKKVLRFPLESRGELRFEGRANLDRQQYRVQGKLAGKDLAYSSKGLAVQGVALDARVDLTPRKLLLADLQLAALGGRFRGAGQVTSFRQVALKGTAQDFPLNAIAHLAGRDTGQLSASLSGPVQLDGTLGPGGLTGVTAQAQLDVAPREGGIPLRGAIAIDFDQRAGRIQLGDSELHLGSTDVAASGILGENLVVHVICRNLNDALPLFPLAGQQPPSRLPVELLGGIARFDGSVMGPLQNPTVSGKADVTRLKVNGRDLDRVTASLSLDRSAANLQAFTVQQGKMHLEGQGRVGLTDWQLEGASTLALMVSVRGADIQALAAEAGIQMSASGAISGSGRISGSLDAPLVTGAVNLESVSAYGEQFASARADVTYTGASLEVAQGELRNGAARVTLSGAYNHPEKDWKDGALRFEVSANALGLNQIKHVQDFRSGLAGRIDLRASGSAKVVNGVIDLSSLNGQASLRNLAVDGRPYGDIELTANTRQPLLALSATVNFGGLQLRGSGEWRTEGDYRGQARIQIPRVTFATLHQLWPGPHEREQLPFGGYLEGEATLSGPLNHPSALQADVTLATVQLNASPGTRPVAGVPAQDLVLRNAAPVHLQATTQSIDIRSASFEAKDTTLNASGRLALNSRNPWDLTIQGRINLTILQIFNPDLLASGASVVNVAMRGPFTAPQVDGRLELQNASLFLRDFPNGVDQANGLILFDRNRATVQKLTAVTGGGDVTFESGSFVGFRGPAVVYHLQATAHNVRYRSEGISMTMDGTVALAGTSENSVLSGTITPVRAAFSPSTDVGALLAATAKPVAAPTTPNQYLRGVQLDLKIVTSRSLELETSQTRNMQADANLRLRGTPERPVLLGDITVSSGQIEFFGNKYNINRGQINFYNAAKIEPIIDMDLETQVRGITVDITFSGPLNKLNFSYRSDPPLEASDIVALLAVGRSPSKLGPLASAQTTTPTSYLSTGSNALLSQAISPASGRLQRFFGVSHIKIDPQLTDITYVPQARLTMEQQVSSAITLTYITNLAVANQQIVRVEWDLNRKWSVVALRDENGAFSIDFQYRKRFR